MTVTSANPYRVQFTLPAGLSVGSSYQVWVYNGHGGMYGWSSPVNLTVASPPVWNSTVNVTAFGAIVNSAGNDGPAIQNALSALLPGQTLYFPAGTYNVSNDQLHLPSNVRILGAGPTASTIHFSGNVPSLGQGAFEIGAYDFQHESNIDFESIGLQYDGPATGQGDASLVREREATGMTFNNVRLAANNLVAIDWEDIVRSFNSETPP